MKKLTNNEKSVVKILLENSRKTDAEIAEKLSLNGSSIARIRSRLMDEGIIKKYSLDIDYEKLGINCYVLVFYSATNNWWNKLEDSDVKKVASSPYIISVFKTNEKNLSYIVLYGFRDNTCANNYFNEVQKTYNEYLVIEKLIFLSNQNIVKNDPTNLIDVINIDNMNTMPNANLFNKIIRTKK